MKKQALIPLLLGCFPVLFLYANNEQELHLLDLLPPLLIALASSILLFLLWWAIMRNAEKASLAVVLAAIGFWSIGFMEGPIHWLEHGNCYLAQHRTLCLAYLAVMLLLLLLPLLMLRWRAFPAQIVPALSIMTLLLIGFSLVQIIPHEATRMYQASRRQAASRQTEKPPAESAAIRPNIIHIVLDAYGRSDILKTRYGVDNEPFLAQLEQRHFYVVRQSRANYNLTLLALASTLNLDYVKGIHADGQDTTPLEEMVQNSRAHSILLLQGYRFVVFESGWPFTNIETADEYHSTASGWSPYHAALLDMTPLPVLERLAGYHSFDFFEQQRQRVRTILDQLPRVRDLDQPVYVFAHILSPHPPFVFQADGSPLQQSGTFSLRDGDDFFEDGGTRKQYREGYAGQVQYLNGQVLAMIDRLQQGMTRPTIIIVHGDHGPGMRLVWDDMQASDLRERMSNFAAIYLPDQNYHGLYPQMTPVNYYRIIFSRYFNADYPLLPDRSFFTNWDHLYTCSPVRQDLLKLDFNENAGEKHPVKRRHHRRRSSI